jgi:hypothetical protein
MKTTTTYSEIAANREVKRTDKAICLNLPVSWNANCYPRDIWFPLSVVKEQLPNGHYMIADWFLNKMEDDRAFHGYRMKFETRF